MANTTPQVIQKDLGLVTAYGYALAGGYQGTEAEFIEDFGKLMSGRIHSDFTFDTIAQMNAAIQTGSVPENATIYCKEETGSSFPVKLYTGENYYSNSYADSIAYITVCGNITHVSIRAILNEPFTIRHKTQNGILTKVFEAESGGELSRETYGFLLPYTTYATDCIDSIGFGFEFEWNSSDFVKNPYIHPICSCSTEQNQGKIYRAAVGYALANESDDDVLVAAGEGFIIEHFFINRVVERTIATL